MNTPFLQREQFFYSVLAFGDPTKVANIDWYYLYRMHILTKKVFLTIAMGLLFTIRYALYINCIADSFKYQTWSARELAKDFKDPGNRQSAHTVFQQSHLAFWLVTGKRSLWSTQHPPATS
ncbi:hypothetical protein QCA50_016567 [Cerrena zonata]|uniref:Uncharacterized protein n=1 Tax=Cerrena zonata TaxID=2478898 RepID=A0AAW0FLY5_9APHY